VASARAGKKTEERIESFAVLVDAGGAVEQIVGIVNFEAPAEFAARADIALRGGGPTADEKILVAEKFGSAPDGVKAEERVAAECGGIAVREDGADAEIFVEVIGDAAGKKICAGDTIGRERKIGDDLRRDDGIARLHVEEREIPFADAAVEFDAGVDGDLRAVEQTNVAAEEGNELR